MFVFPQNSYVETESPTWQYVEVRPLWWLDHEGVALMMGLVPL